MTNTEQKLKQLYELYSQKKYSEAFSIVEEILKTDPQNTYALKYKNLILPYLNKKSEVGKIATIKAKNLKCPHCEASIALSALNDEQKTKIRENNYSGLEIKCPYCHTVFTLQKKNSDSIIGVGLGDKITYNGKNYRTVGAVLYAGKWYEGYYSGVLEYLEWILVGDDNSYLYFSEGYFYDDGAKKYFFELSEKVVPDFEVALENQNLQINGRTVAIKSKDIVSTKKLYGENSKVFQVGESVELYSFNYNGKKYILEKEKAGRQSEAGIYTSVDISKKYVCDLFGKEYKISRETKEGIIPYGIVGTLFGGIFTALYSKIIFIIFILVVIFIVLFAFGLQKSKKAYIFVIGPIFGFFLVPILLSAILETKNEVSLDEIGISDKYLIEFNNPDLRNVQITGSSSYDYGGTRYYYKETTGLEFSVGNRENDFEIIKNLQNNFNDASSEVQEVFKEKIYKLR